MKKLIRIGLSLCMAVMLSTVAMAVELSLDNGAITITSTGYTQDGGEELLCEDDYTIAGSFSSDEIAGITVASGSHNITLNGVTIESTSPVNVPISLTSGVTANITVVGTNTVKTPGTGYAAISVPADAALSLTGETGSRLTTDGSGMISADSGNDTGTITIDGNLILNTTGIGAYDAANSGDITIGGNANVTVAGGYGIGGGHTNIGTITIQDNASVTVTTDNSGCAGIGAKQGGTSTGSIVIDTTGTVTATGGKFSAGIGVGGFGGTSTSSVSVEIINGDVIATGGESGAGIGCGQQVDCSGTVTISGGTVTATGAGNGAGIGAGYCGSMNVAISGGTVNATGAGAGADIGGALSSYGGTVTISGGMVTATTNGIGEESGRNWGFSFSTGTNGSAVIITSRLGIYNDDFKADTYSGVFFVDMLGSDTENKPISVVYGTPTLSQNLTIPADKTLTIQAGHKLTVPEGVTLTNNGTLTLQSKDGLEGAGTLDGGGTFQVVSDVLTDEMITLSDDLLETYDGTQHHIDNNVTVTKPSNNAIIMGKTFPTTYDFTVNNDGTVTGWKRKMTLDENSEDLYWIKDAGTYTITYTKNIDHSQTASKTYEVKPATLTREHMTIEIADTFSGNPLYGENITFRFTTKFNEDPIQGTYKIYNTDDSLLATRETEAGIAQYETSTLGVGDHEIYAVFTPSESNFVAEEVTSRTVSIEVAAASITVTDFPTWEFSYDGKQKDINVQAVSNTVATADFDYTVTYKLHDETEYQNSQPTMVNAGVYVVDYQVSSVGHPTVTGSTTVTIKRALNSINLTCDGWTYGERANTLSMSAAHDAESVVYTYEQEQEDGSYLVIEDFPSQAGTYKITATIPESTNYTEATTRIGLSIRKATMSHLPSSEQTIAAAYTGETQIPDFSINPITVDDTEVTVKYGTSSAEYTMDTMPSYTNARSENNPYTIYYEITAENHEDVNGSVLFNITAYDIANLTANGGDTRTVVGGNVTFAEPTFTGLGDDGTLTGTLTYSYDSIENLTYDAFVTALNQLPFADDTQINIGYTFTVDNGNNYTGTKTGTLTTTVKNIIFDGDMTAATTATYGDTWGEILDFAHHNYSAKVGTDVVAGTYTLKIDGTDNNSTAIPTVKADNGTYSWAVTFTSTDGTTYVNVPVDSGTVLVEKRTATYTWDATTFAYDGTAKLPSPTITNAVGADTVTVTATGTETNVGDSYTATAVLTGDNGNYALPEENPNTTFAITAVAAEGSISMAITDTDSDETLNAGDVLTMTYTNTLVGETATYQWYKDGATIENAISESYTLTALDTEGGIHCVVTLSGNTTGTLIGETATIGSSAPSITAISTTPGNGTVTINWTVDNGGRDITGYSLSATYMVDEVATDAGGSYEIATTATSYTVTGLTNGTEYTFILTATNDLGSADSEQVTGLPYQPTSSGGGGGGGSITPPTETTEPSTEEVTKPDGTTTATTTATVKPSVSNGHNTTTSTVKDKDIDNAIDQALDSKDDNHSAQVEIKVESKKDTPKVEVSLTTSAITSVANSDVNDLTITTGIGSVTMPSEAAK